jgi:hypothetical protein
VAYLVLLVDCYTKCATEPFPQYLLSVIDSEMRQLFRRLVK